MMVVVTIIDAWIFSVFREEERTRPDTGPLYGEGREDPLSYTLFLLFLLISTHPNTATHIPPMGAQSCVKAQWKVTAAQSQVQMGGKLSFAAVSAKVSNADEAPIRCGYANVSFREFSGPVCLQTFTSVSQICATTVLNQSAKANSLGSGNSVSGYTSQMPLPVERGVSFKRTR